MHSSFNVSLVLVGHGSTLNPDSSFPTQELARRLRARKIFDEVLCCFWKEEPSMREVHYMIETPHVFVVPVFISEGYFTQTIIPRELGLTGPITKRFCKNYYYCNPVGSHSSMTDVLLQRSKNIAPDLNLSQTSLIIVAHGTALNDNSARAAKQQVSTISKLGIFGEVLAAYMEEPPLISDWHKLTSFQNVIVVPFFISDGLHSYEDIPVLMGIESQASLPASKREVFRRNPYLVHNKKLYYASAIGTDPLMLDVILDLVREFQAKNLPNFIIQGSQESGKDGNPSPVSTQSPLNPP
ncbi:MAG: cobalamin biosynthesis protein CbiX [Chthoniobacterales bacterium]|nr:cobalamin biosynthesis protein CbiX [Chthoniobacterales bacterium]